MISLSSINKKIEETSIEWMDVKKSGILNESIINYIYKIGFPSDSKVSNVSDFENVSVHIHKERDGYLSSISAIIYGSGNQFNLYLYDRIELLDPYNEYPDLQDVNLLSKTLLTAKVEAEMIIEEAVISYLNLAQEMINRYI